MCVVASRNNSAGRAEPHHVVVAVWPVGRSMGVIVQRQSKRTGHGQPAASAASCRRCRKGARYWMWSARAMGGDSVCGQAQVAVGVVGPGGRGVGTVCCMHPGAAGREGGRRQLWKSHVR